MPYAHKNYKLTFGGGVYQGKDEWSNSLHLGQPGLDIDTGILPVDMQEMVDSLAANIQTWFTSAGASISLNANLQWVKLAIIGTDGLYETEPYIYDFATPPVGSLALAIAPQLSVVQTMETDALRGAARFGRIYPPLTGNVNNAGFIDNSTTRNTAFKALLIAINNTMKLAYTDPIFAPQVIVASKVGAGKNALVKKVRCGNVIDTMRSRRNKFVETYDEQTL